MKKINVLLFAFLLLGFGVNAQRYPFNGGASRQIPCVTLEG